MTKTPSFSFTNLILAGTLLATGSGCTTTDHDTLYQLEPTDKPTYEHVDTLATETVTTTVYYEQASQQPSCEAIVVSINETTLYDHDCDTRIDAANLYGKDQDVADFHSLEQAVRPVMNEALRASPVIYQIDE